MKIATILFSSRDHSFFLHRALKSIESQTFKSHLVILVYSHFVNLPNDEEELENNFDAEYDFPIYCIKNMLSNNQDTNGYDRINEILKKEDIEIITFFDDSSEMLSSRLEIVEELFQDDELEIVSHNAIDINDYTQQYNLHIFQEYQNEISTDITKGRLDFVSISISFWDKLLTSDIKKIKHSILQMEDIKEGREKRIHISNNLVIVHKYANSAPEIILHTICEKKRIAADNMGSYIECEKIYNDWISNKIHLNSMLTMKLMYEFFIVTWYVNNYNCIELTERMNELLKRDDIQVEFLKYIDHYTTNFDYTIHLLNYYSNKKKICVYKDISAEEEQKLCSEYQVYKYVKKDKDFLSGNYLCTSNPVIRSIDRFKDMSYDITIYDETDPNYLSNKVLFLVIASFNHPVYMEMIKYRKLQFKKYNLKHYFLFDGPIPDNYVLDEEDIVFEKPKGPFPIKRIVNPDMNPHMVLKFIKAIKTIDLTGIDYVARINISTFVDFKKLNSVVYHLPRDYILSGKIFKEPVIPHFEFYKTETFSFVLGTFMLFSIDVIEFLQKFNEDNPMLYLNYDDTVLSHLVKHYVSTFKNQDMLYVEKFPNLEDPAFIESCNKHFLIRIKNPNRNDDLIVWRYLLKNIDKIEV